MKSRLHRARVAVREALAPLLSVPAPAAGAPVAGSCPDVVAMFSRHLEGEISSSVCADLERHLAACPECRDRCDSLQRTLALCKAAPLPEVPERVQASVRQAIRKFVAVHAEKA